MEAAALPSSFAAADSHNTDHFHGQEAQLYEHLESSSESSRIHWRLAFWLISYKTEVKHQTYMAPATPLFLSFLAATSFLDSANAAFLQQRAPKVLGAEFTKRFLSKDDAGLRLRRRQQPVEVGLNNIDIA